MILKEISINLLTNYEKYATMSTKAGINPFLYSFFMK